jgi:hypothetical protein
VNKGVTFNFPENIRKRLPGAAVENLEIALSNMEEWTDALPKQSLFYLNEKVPLRKAPLPPRMQFDVNVADGMYDIYSLLVSQLLTKSWRAKQLAEGVKMSLDGWNLTIAATAVRGLIETISAWFIESKEVAESWKILRLRKVKSIDDILDIRKSLFMSAFQMAWGTRLPSMVKGEHGKKLKRTSIQALIKKAEATMPRPGLYERYEILCDAVHPSWGSDELFWLEAGPADTIPQVRCLLSLESVGQIDTNITTAITPGSPVSHVIFSEAAWALNFLLEAFRAYDSMCRDIFLTAKLYILSDLNFWGVIKPSDSYEPCACGSGKKTRFCPHEFGNGSVHNKQ